MDPDCLPSYSVCTGDVLSTCRAVLGITFVLTRCKFRVVVSLLCIDSRLRQYRLCRDGSILYPRSKVRVTLAFRKSVLCWHGRCLEDPPCSTAFGDCSIIMIILGGIPFLGAFVGGVVDAFEILTASPCRDLGGRAAVDCESSSRSRAPCRDD